MSTYLQWSRSKPVRRVTWVCGPEPCLVREVTDAHRAGAPPGQCAALFAGDVPEHEVWDFLFTCPPPGGSRTVVHGAERLHALGNVAVLAAEGPDTAFTVFVSSADDFDHDEQGAMAPYLKALGRSRDGQAVRCCAPSKPEDRAALVASWWPGASASLARDLLARCGTLEAACQACEKARRAGLAPAPAAARLVSVPRPGDSLADFLFAGDRLRAMEAAAGMPRGEVGGLIGLLASRLAVAGEIGEGTRQGMTAREAAQNLRSDRFTASRVLPHVTAYGPDRIRRLRRVLAVAEAAWRSGAGTGVAESVVAQWI